MTRLRHSPWPKGTWMYLLSPTKLRAEMAGQKMSERRLARYAGCSPGMISHLKTGRRRSVSPRLAVRITEALRVDLGEFFSVNLPTEQSQNRDGAAA